MYAVLIIGRLVHPPGGDFLEAGTWEGGNQHLPSNLLDDVADEGGALAQVTLGAGDTGLDDAGGGFLQLWNRPIISFKVHHPRHASRSGGQRRDPPRGETGLFNVRGPC